MQLTKLELHGFKSFADPTELSFKPGVTAIVGPNGCGKSNVSDAVRWVLGEQRARLLRGAKMEEVIFQGSSARKPVNIAEVSLHFENEDGALPIAYKEVVITRRLSRSGESEYLLNRTPCRLRDIHDLLRGTGLAADVGVVIESRMIDALLSDRPDDRRELFEEAAGVGLYRDRRRSTERRLEETSGDLARIDDLINEVGSQVRSLARQRRKAERHAEVMARRRSVELTLAEREMAAWKDELARLDTELVELRTRTPEGAARVSAAEGARDAAYAARSAADTGRQERTRIAMSLRESQQQLQREVAVAEERHQNAVARRQRAEQERNEGAAFGDRLRNEWDAARVEETKCESDLKAAAEALQAAVTVEEAARGEVTAAREALGRVESTVRELRDRIRRMELEREGAEREAGEVAQRSSVLSGEHEQLADQLRLAERDFIEAADALVIAQAAAEAAIAGRDTARATARECGANEAAARADLRRVEEEYTGLQGKLNALEGLERERVGLAPAAARLLRDRAQFGEGAVLGPLSDFIGADSSAAALVERFLGPIVHAVVVRDGAVATAVRQWHAQSDPGALLLLPLDALTGTDDVLGAEELASRVQAEGPVRSWVRALLGKVRTVDDGTAFVDARGAVWLPGRGTGAGPLRRKAELFQLRVDLQTIDARRQEARAALQRVHADVVAAESAAASAAEAADNAQQEAQRASSLRADRDGARARLQREHTDAEALAERLAARHADLTARVADGAARMQQESVTLTEAERSAVASREALAGAEQRQDAARETRAAAQVLHAQTEARRQVAGEREERLAFEQASAAARLDALTQELVAIDASDDELARQITAWQEDLAGRTQSLVSSEQALEAAEGAVRAADAALGAAEHDLDASRREATSLAEALHHAELRHTELGGKRAAIRERLEAEWRKPLEDLLADYVALELDDDALRAEVEQLRRQIEALGPVNELAVEEHDEAGKRFEFLTTQRADLSDAQRALQQAIREIDTTAREMFLKTFAEVREHFRNIFMTLFGGGECDLRLENPELPLDCDIEIHASPRGKRTQRINLLSSGERALVALSLLFGIFLTKPSPFCLLDEVDAPLDDQNVGRFVKMLSQFKANTQFIVITHNPRTTTEAADAVYGVTMQEPGVSSLVSVRMKGQPVDEDAVETVSAS
ncbi:MAG TPA: chromosome segregation protein SMC [Gemmatimonadaceae bacterium]